MNKAAVVTGVVVIVIVGAYVVMTLTGNSDESLELTVAGSACTLGTSASEKDVEVKKNKKVTWAVKNSCTSAQTVTLGNLRTALASTKTSCTDATEGGATWPFKDQDQNNRSVTVQPGNTGDIVLKEAKNQSGAALTYYFDICIGSVKADPRLVIEP